MGNICVHRDKAENDLGRGVSKKSMIGLKTHNILRDYDIEKTLGFGSYGEVNLGRHKKTN